jgi:hypothetical protein
MRTLEDIHAEISRRAIYLEGLEENRPESSAIVIEYAILRSLLWTILTDAEVRNGTRDRLLFEAIDTARSDRISK